jgi:glycosyltransferase involved in cell wall biosynthesis
MNQSATWFLYKFRGHNNSRFEALVHGLREDVAWHGFTFSDRRLVRGAQFRLWKLVDRRVVYPWVLPRLARRYQVLMTVEAAQIAFWPREKSVILDIDDPWFTPEEIESLNLPQVKAIVTTTTKAKNIYLDAGVRNPILVIPQPVASDGAGAPDPKRVESIRASLRKSDELVVGYSAPTFTVRADGPRRARNGLDDIDLLIAAMERARRTEPRLVLWLIGSVSTGVRKLAAQRAWIRMLGYLPLNQMLDYTANFDIAVYPRTVHVPPAHFSVKIAQYLTCGIPIVATEVDEASFVLEAEAGRICRDEDAFSTALSELASSPELRGRLGEAGRRYARANLDWQAGLRTFRELLRS